MKLRIEATGSATFPEDIQVGDMIRGDIIARVISIEEEIVDIIRFSGEGPEFTAGEKRAKLLITNAITAREPRP